VPPKTPRPSEPTQRWTFLQLFGLVKRNPLMLSRWVICWALIGIVCGLFAGLYWNNPRVDDARPRGVYLDGDSSRFSVETSGKTVNLCKV
jgi:hypothetical protein